MSLDIHTTAQLKRVLGVKIPRQKVIKFYNQWCPHAQGIAQAYEQLAAQYPQLLFLKVDMDELPEVAHDLNIQAGPTFSVLSGKTETHRITGANLAQLVEAIEQS